MRYIIPFILLVFSVSVQAYTAEEFYTFKQNLAVEALNKGIDPAIVSDVLANAEFLPRVIELDQKQPEGTMTFARYRERIVNPDRIALGRQKLAANREVLERVEAKYGVAPQYIVALWGIETNYGGFTGGTNVVDALTTLAYEGRRGDFFKKELFNALTILDEGHITPAEMKGSWAGALGQNQFMPSSFQSLAVDGNNDGRKDIWNDLEDVFSSSANYLARNGWNEGERWGRSVKLPSNFNLGLEGRSTKKPIREWQALGVRMPDGSDLPTGADMLASIVVPDHEENGLAGPAYMVYNNYSVIMSWNRSIYFATSVGLLADAIATAR